MPEASTPCCAPVLHLADVQPQPRPPEWQPAAPLQRRIAGRMAPLGPALGLQHLGCSLVVVSPGEQAYPFHSHRHNDELFVILAGEGQLRLGDGLHPVRAGDVVGCPAGDARSAHALINTGEVELRYLALSSKHSPEVCHYPDSGKVGIYEDTAPGGAEPFYYMGKVDAHVDYWDGE